MAAKKKRSAKQAMNPGPAAGGRSAKHASSKRGSDEAEARRSDTAAAARRAVAKGAPASPRASAEKSRAAATAARGPVRKKPPVAAARPAPARAAQKAPVVPASVESGAPLEPGDRAPSFELPDQAGASLSSASLAGQPYVLYFYPKDDTPGCTTQACGFRDAFSGFERAGVRVIGVSPDSIASHEKFVRKHALPFTLLSDASRELATAYGVWALKKNYGREFMGIVRSTFLIDGGGRVRKVWRGVRVNGHVPAVQAAAAELA